MKIETYWDDIETYYVTFLIDNGNRKIDKLIAIKNDMPIEEIHKTIEKNFFGVEKILHVDHWGSGLLLKDK